MDIEEDIVNMLSALNDIYTLTQAEKDFFQKVIDDAEKDVLNLDITYKWNLDRKE